MDDLISRKALLKTIEQSLAYRLKAQEMDKAVGMVHEAPTIDAVEVVRCRDCRLHDNCTTEDVFKIARISNPFCCAGRRKDGADGRSD